LGVNESKVFSNDPTFKKLFGSGYARLGYYLNILSGFKGLC